MEVLEKGVHSYNKWSLALERWSESPSANSLMAIPIWVIIHNIPINYYIEKAI